jgi:membrane fusion protein (multidrug efflux system)
MNLRFAIAILIVGSVFTGCSRKPAPAGPPAPEVLVTTVQPRDVPRVLERIATLDGFINANINAQVQGYIISRDYQEGSLVKKGDLLFQIDPRPFEAALAQAKATLMKDQAAQTKSDADQKRALDLFERKVISDQERDTAIAAARSSQAKVEADVAMDWLRSAVAAGYKDAGHMAKNTDLEVLRKRPDFIELLAGLSAEPKKSK